jgi:hypothetical protein
METSEIQLRLSGNKLLDSQVQLLSSDLLQSLREEAIGVARRSSHQAAPGMKGDPVTIGAIVLTLIGGGGVLGKLIDVFKAYIERQPSVEFELEKTDGSKIKIKAANMSGDNIVETSKMLEKFLGT